MPLSVPVSEILSENPLGFVLSESTVIGIPIAFFAGESEIMTKEEELVIIHDFHHKGAPLILGVLRYMRRLEPFLRRYQRVSVIDFPEAIDNVEKLPYTNGIVIPLAELKLSADSEEEIVGIERNVTYVPFPGSKVYKIRHGAALTDLLRTLLPEGTDPLILGHHKYTEGLEIPLDPKYIPYHIGVFGATGMGKSRLVKVLIDEIVTKTNYAVIVFDHTGMDYTVFYPGSTIESLRIKLDPLTFSSWLAKKLRLSEYLVDYVEISVLEIFRDYAQSEWERLSDIIINTENEEERDLAIKQLHARLSDKIARTAGRLGAKDTTISKLSILMDLLVHPNELARVFVRELPPEQVLDMAYKFKEQGKPLVIDLSLEDTIEAKRSVIASIIEAAWNRILATRKSLNLIIAVDEAQNYAWRAGRCEEGLTRIAREGRKWGFGLIIASQRLAGSVSTDIRANMNTVLFSKLSQTGDLNEIKQFADITGIEQSDLAQLVPREFYVAGLMNPLRKPIAIRVKEVHI